MRERDGTMVYPPYTMEATGAMFEKVHPSEPVNKEFPINPFPLQGFTFNGTLKKPLDESNKKVFLNKIWRYDH